MWCCNSKINSRVTIIGKNNKNSTIVWQKLTKLKSISIPNYHLEKSINLNNKKISLCTLETQDLALWEINIKHSEGIILVIDATESASEEVRMFIEEAQICYVLVLCHTKNIGDTFVEENTQENVKFVVCNLDEWKGVDEGLKWLTDQVKNLN